MYKTLLLFYISLYPSSISNINFFYLYNKIFLVLLSLQIFNDHYHFAHTQVQKRSLDASHHHQSKLVNDHRINWALQQKAKSRQKRDYQKRSSRMLSFRRTLLDEVNLIDPKWSSMWYLVSIFFFFFE